MKKNRAKKATPLTVAIAAIIWILAGCSSAPAHTAAHTSAHPAATSPAAQMAAWKNGPGYVAFSKVDADLNGVSDMTSMTPAQIRQTIKDVKAAEKYPLPAGVDPGGYYLDALIHFQKGLIAAQNANPFAALTQMTAGVTSANHFVAEVKRVS